MSHKAHLIPSKMTELAEALIKHHGVHEGFWRIYFKFEMTATNVNFKGHMYPAALLPITEVGLMREADDKHSILAVDAAIVNPRSRILSPFN